MWVLQNIRHIKNISWYVYAQILNSYRECLFNPGIKYLIESVVVWTVKDAITKQFKSSFVYSNSKPLNICSIQLRNNTWVLWYVAVALSPLDTIFTGIYECKQLLHMHSGSRDMLSEWNICRSCSYFHTQCPLYGIQMIEIESYDTESIEAGEIISPLDMTFLPCIGKRLPLQGYNKLVIRLANISAHVPFKNQEYRNEIEYNFLELCICNFMK